MWVWRCDMLPAVGAALLLGHNTLARGRDLAAEPTVGVGPTRDLTVAAFDWRAGAALSPPAVIVWLHPTKDAGKDRQRYPMVVQRRSHTAPLGSDPMCAYDALVLAWPVLADSVPPTLRADTLFFRRPAAGVHPALWPPVRSEDIRAWIQEAAAAAGLDPAPFGAKALRMGGATDLYDLLGKAGGDIIKERGRWCSEIAQIYQRVSASAHGAISRAIGDSQGVDLQSMLTGWSQDTSVYRRC